MPSIYAFLIERCAFPERRAKRCAHIAKMRNIMHINKLYDVMLTVEAMKVTNFSFKDIGVFHRDEKRVTAALKSYFGVSEFKFRQAIFLYCHYFTSFGVVHKIALLFIYHILSYNYHSTHHHTNILIIIKHHQKGGSHNQFRQKCDERGGEQG